MKAGKISKIISIAYLCLVLLFFVLSFFHVGVDLKFDSLIGNYYKPVNFYQLDEELNVIIILFVLFTSPLAIINVFLSDNYGVIKFINCIILTLFSIAEFIMILVLCLFEGTYGDMYITQWLILTVLSLKLVCISISCGTNCVNITKANKNKKMTLNPFNKLKELYELKKQGIISEEEFDLIKQKYIDQI